MSNIFKEKRQITKFLIVGLSGVFVNMFFLWLFRDIFQMNIGLAGVLAIELSVINNFVFNNLWTFWNRKSHQVHFRFIRYHLSVLLGIVLNYVILIFLSEVVGVYYLLSNLIGIGCATISNYLLSSRWAWKSP